MIKHLLKMFVACKIAIFPIVMWLCGESRVGSGKTPNLIRKIEKRSFVKQYSNNINLKDTIAIA